MICNLCPRMCGVDRAEQKGYCGCGIKPVVAYVMEHHWEEPCISGTNGSGCVFFSGCQLKCVYCQNKQISRSMTGEEKTPSQLAEIFLELQSKKMHNINLVTPDHFAEPICKAVEIARRNGLTVPIVWNCSGYVNIETLQKIKSFVNIYLTDFKYVSTSLSSKYSSCPNYFEKTSLALNEMVSQHPCCEYDENGIMKSGVIVRHLVLPSHTEDSMKVLEYVYRTHGDNVVISIMNQFTPIELDGYPEINRKLTTLEYDRVVNHALSLGIKNAYTQSRESAKESFIPKFR